MTLDSPSAYLLVFHGSHDERSQTAAQELTEIVRQRLHSATVQDVYLECHSLSLHQQIEQIAQQIAPELPDSNPTQWVIVPVFLLAGTHVMQDIPAEISLAQHHLQQQVQLTVTPHLGSQPGLRSLISARMASVPVTDWILLAHGSRRAGANQCIEELAKSLGAIAAYWSTAPNLNTRLQEFSDAGVHQVGIFPYFLFSGGITEAIAQTISQSSQPPLSLTLTEPLNATAELADLLLKLIETELNIKHCNLSN